MLLFHISFVPISGHGRYQGVCGREVSQVHQARLRKHRCQCQSNNVEHVDDRSSRRNSFPATAVSKMFGRHEHGEQHERV